MDTNQYLEMFIEESKEHLQACNEHLLELEKNPENIAIVNEVFRSAHTLKGMSATMGYEDIANLTHKMENVLDEIRNSRLHVTAELLDVVFVAVDQLEEMVLDIAAGGKGKLDVTDTVQKLHKIETGEVIPVAATTVEPTIVEDTTPTQENWLTYDDYEMTVIQQSVEQDFFTYEISVKLREDCLLKAARVYMVFELLEKMGDVIKSSPSVEKLEGEDFDEIFYVALVTNEPSDDVQKKLMKVSEVTEVLVNSVTLEQLKKRNSFEVDKVEETSVVEMTDVTEDNKQIVEVKSPEKSPTSKNNQVQSSKTIRVNIERLDILMNLFEELVIDRGRLQSISEDLHNSELDETVERMSRITGDLQNIILNMRMVPVETVFNRFPRMVRQLARDLNKKINLEVIGAETELDRTVIDEIGDPLVHLIRNSLDHGVESPEIRLAKGKPEEGTVVLRAYHSGNHVFIEIEDDGAGINREKVLKKAISKGIVSKESAQAMSDKQVAELILSSGFSTADVISDVSGRGVGLDVVKTTIESLGGSIDISSTEGQGSLFSIQLPLTLSIISVMLVELGEEIYAIPLSSIIETAIIRSTDILNAHNQKVIDFRGKVVPLVFLENVFDVPRESTDDEFHSVVLVRKGDKMAGLVVDSFIGQQEIVLKSLGAYLSSVFAISGATILGNGKVALIVDCNALIS
ncbi:chemotaxis protein CheA [Psychrobacillus psychrodurans]|uniref:chemotaxis protein CheA n=1 Tax=Psychrobacillus psychrodurans TaxID=126157 RepID=UPI0008E30330|nr:chemotaxis protein CheA [Psychrobacillus psychrodurans]MCZ8539556.1 chemotaxis protein CheA [Psychrobacillus psychrodurans]SFM41601.1 two-component system, chemotaxis family, sensor kinase CheA [Psychrobacillus psychrodurans]